MIQRSRLPLREGGRTVWPSSVMADLSVTNGRRVVIQVAKDSLSCRDSHPALRAGRPLHANACLLQLPEAAPGDCGFGSGMAATTRATPAAMSARVQGPVRPVWQQGSRLM